MDAIYYLIGYVPLVAVLTVFLVRYFRHTKRPAPEAAGGVKEYPHQERAIPHADRILADDGPSLKDSDMEETMPKLARAVKIAKSSASHFMPRPSSNAYMGPP